MTSMFVSLSITLHLRQTFHRLIIITFTLLLSSRAIASADDRNLVNIKDINPAIVVDMRYATLQNFTGQRLYPSNDCLLCAPVAQRLSRVQKKLEKEGVGLKVWDCYRPLSIQKEFWKLIPDTRYVADPKTGSRHNRGASVDVTLVDRRGRELKMPTGFDDFSERAERHYPHLSKRIISRRTLLQSAMESEGFRGIETEWWHYDDPDWKLFPLQNESFDNKKLKKSLNKKEPLKTEEPSLHSIQIPDQTKQLLLVITPGWEATTGQLQFLEKKENGWVRRGEPQSVSVGLHGMAWACDIEPLDQTDRLKTESDKRAPAGIFKIGKAYGYSSTAPTGSQWPYQQVDSNWVCVDDPASKYYNRVLSTSSITDRDWSSAEMMKRPDHLYKWVLNLDHNFPDVKAGCGSCIFLHVWRRPQSPTAGCTAMTEDAMVDILRWLDPEASPHLIQLPQDIYDQLTSGGKLP